MPLLTTENHQSPRAGKPKDIQLNHGCLRIGVLQQNHHRAIVPMDAIATDEVRLVKRSKQFPLTVSG